MGHDLGVYEKAVLDRICAVCIDRRDEGSCGLDPRLECAVKEHLPVLLTSLKGVNSDNATAYLERIRLNVCTICNQGTAADCDVRGRADCVLDRYLNLVVEAVEEVERIRAGEAQASAP